MAVALKTNKASGPVSLSIYTVLDEKRPNLLSCLDYRCPRLILALDSVHREMVSIIERTLHIRAVWLVARTTPRQGWPMLLWLPYSGLAL